MRQVYWWGHIHIGIQTLLFRFVSLAYRRSWAHCGRWGASSGDPRAWSGPPAWQRALWGARSIRHLGFPKSVQQQRQQTGEQRAAERCSITCVTCLFYHHAAVLRAAGNDVVIVRTEFDVEDGPRVAAHGGVGHVDTPRLQKEMPPNAS